MRGHRHRKARPPLDGEGLERLALFYVSRYATTRSKLRAYLARKVEERGWAHLEAPPIEALIARFERLGYIDDRAFAVARAASLGRRGYGERRVTETLRAAGITHDDAADARDAARDGAWAAALRFAERRRIGPFAPAPLEHDERRKALAAMLRAGHSMDIALKFIHAAPGDVPDKDNP